MDGWDEIACLNLKKGGWLLCSLSRVNPAYLHLFFLSHARALTLSLSLNSAGIRLSCHCRDWWSLALEIVPAFVSVPSVRRCPCLALFLSKSASNPKELPPRAISLHLALTAAFVLLRQPHRLHQKLQVRLLIFLKLNLVFWLFALNLGRI